MGCYLLLSRSYRKVNNRFVIHLGQLSVVISIAGGLFLIQVLGEQLGTKRHSSLYYAAFWAFILGCGCVIFFSLRADLRWQKSVGLDRIRRFWTSGRLLGSWPEMAFEEIALRAAFRKRHTSSNRTYGQRGETALL